MSHFSTLSVRIMDKIRAKRIADSLGWRAEIVALYVNPYTSRENVENATVYRDRQGHVKLVIDSEGSAVVDPYYMGREYMRFFQEYGLTGIQEAAYEEGGCVTDVVPQTDGDILVYVEF